MRGILGAVARTNRSLTRWRAHGRHEFPQRTRNFPNVDWLLAAEQLEKRFGTTNCVGSRAATDGTAVAVSTLCDGSLALERVEPCSDSVMIPLFVSSCWRSS